MVRHDREGDGAFAMRHASFFAVAYYYFYFFGPAEKVILCCPKADG